MIKPLAFAAAVLLAGGAAPAPSDDATLRRITQEMLDAIAPGHAEVWDRYLAPDLLYVDENDTVLTRAELIRNLTPLPAGVVGTSTIDAWQSHIDGDVAVTTHEDQEHLDYHGQPIFTRFRVTDTWRRTPQGWRLIAEHAMAVLKDPPVYAGKIGCDAAGRYRLTETIETVITCDGSALTSTRTGGQPTIYKPETRDVFFAPGKPRTRRIFFRDAAGKVTGFGDRREGEDIRWTKIG